MLGHQYNVNIQDATAVTTCTWCQCVPQKNGDVFMEPLHRAKIPFKLLIARSSKLYAFSLAPTGGLISEDLPGLTDRIFGRVLILKPVYVPSFCYDFLFLLTDDTCYIVRYVHEHGRLKTMFCNKLDTHGVMRRENPIVTIDPTCSNILMHVYQNHFEVIRIGIPHNFDQVVSERSTEVDIRGLCFLPMDNCSFSPILVSLFGKNERTYVKGSVLDFLKDPEDYKNSQLKTDWWIGKEVSGCTFLEPVEGLAVRGVIFKPAVLLLGNKGRLALLTAEYGIDHFSSDAAAYDDFVCCARIPREDLRQYLVCDALGNYGLLNIDTSTDPTWQRLRNFGKFGVASCMSVLAFNPMDAIGQLYIGSSMGNSKLIEFCGESPVKSKVTSSYNNIGPILDFCVVDEDLSASFCASGRFFTCSGTESSGSLRIAEVGIGMVPLHSLKSAAQKAFTVNENGRPLVLTSFHPPGSAASALYSIVRKRTPIDLDPRDMDVEMDPEDDSTLTLCEVSPADTRLLLDEPTVWCGNVGEDVVQVTSRHITGPLTNSVRMDSTCVAASSSNQHLAVGLVGCTLIYYNVLDTPGGSLAPCSHHTAAEIACITTDGELIAVGLWDFSVEIFLVPDSKQRGSLVSVARIYPTGEPDDLLSSEENCFFLSQNVIKPPLRHTVVRSLLLHTFGIGECYLFVGLARGMLCCYSVTNEPGNCVLSLVTSICLGKRMPAILSIYDANSVLVAAQQPVVIQCKIGGHLMIDKLNLKNVTFAARVPHLDDDDDVVAFLCADRTIKVEAIVEKKAALYVKTMFVGGSPIRVAYHKSTELLCVSVLPIMRELYPHMADNNHPQSMPLAMLRFYDSGTLEHQCTVSLEPQEQTGALLCAQFSVGSPELLVAGITFVLPHESEPTRGRLVLFTVSRSTKDEKYSIVSYCSAKTTGAVYSLKQVGDKLASTVNNGVVIWAIQRDRLVPLCLHDKHAVALHLDVLGDLILVGDMMRSACLLRLVECNGSVDLEEVSENWDRMWLTAAAIQTPNTFIGADDFRNLITFYHNSEKNERKLEVVGRYNCGEHINCMQRHNNVVYWASKDGALGYIRSLPEENFTTLLRIQNQIIEHLTDSTLKIRHDAWRSFQKEYSRAEIDPKEDHKGYIDGDLLRIFVDAHEPEALDQANDWRTSSTYRLVAEIQEQTRFDFGEPHSNADRKVSCLHAFFE